MALMLDFTGKYVFGPRGDIEERDGEVKAPASDPMCAWPDVVDRFRAQRDGGGDLVTGDPVSASRRSLDPPTRNSRCPLTTPCDMATGTA